MSAFTDDHYKSLGGIFKDPENGEPFTTEVSPELLWILYAIIDRWGKDRACDVLTAGALLVKHELSDYDQRRLRAMIMEIEAIRVLWRDQEEMVLFHTFRLLYEKKMSRRDAAEYASSILGRKISTDAWRKRVDRWAETREFPKVDLYSRNEDTSDKPDS